MDREDIEEILNKFNQAEMPVLKINGLVFVDYVNNKMQDSDATRYTNFGLVLKMHIASDMDIDVLEIKNVPLIKTSYTLDEIRKAAIIGFIPLENISSIEWDDVDGKNYMYNIHKH